MVLATYRYPYTGLYATTFSLQNFYLEYSSWKFHSMIQYQYPIFVVTQDETMAVEISTHQLSICQKANGQFCNINALLQLLANPQSCITALYVKNAASITTRCSLQIRKAQNISIPLSINPNEWILSSAPSTVTTTITLICSGEITKFITVQKPIHVLQLPPACSTTSSHFHLPPQYEPPTLAVNISLDTANLNMLNMSS